MNDPRTPNEAAFCAALARLRCPASDDERSDLRRMVSDLQHLAAELRAFLATAKARAPFVDDEGYRVPSP